MQLDDLHIKTVGEEVYNIINPIYGGTGDEGRIRKNKLDELIEKHNKLLEIVKSLLPNQDK